MTFSRCLALLLAFGLEVQAATPLYQAGPLQVGDVRAAPTPPVASVGAVYLWIANQGARADRLIGVQTPAAETVEIHRSTMTHGVMQMRQVDGVECPPHATVKIEPGALHLMLLGLKQPLRTGSEFPLTLKFRDEGMLVVQVSVGASDRE